MKIQKKLTAAILALALLGATSGCQSDTAGGSNSAEGTIKIGLHFEMTGSVADYGVPEQKAALLAINQANEKAGEEKYTTITYDNKSDATEAVTLAAQLVSDGVTAVIGPATSGASAASYQILNDAQILVISPSATQNNITLQNPSDASSSVYEYIFRVCFEDSYQGAAMAQYAYDSLNKRKAIIYADSTTDYASGLTAAFTEQFEKLGGTIVAVENYVSNDTDFASVLTRIKDMDFDCLYIPGYYNEAGLIIKQARALGIDTDILGPDGFDSASLVDLGGEENLNNVYFTTAYTTVGASAELEQFIADYKAAYNEEPNMFAALAYDGANALIQAIEAAGSSDPEAIQQAMAKIQFEGITGSFSFDEAHTPIKSVLVVEMVNGVQSNAVSVSPKMD